MNKNTELKLKEITPFFRNELKNLYDPQEASAIARLILDDLGLDGPFTGISDQAMSPTEMSKILQYLEELKKGRPVQYVLGYAWFYDRKFKVNENCLIPRQETEELVRLILKENEKPELSILDLGSGSGNIGITLALEMHEARVTCLDVDPDALTMAKKNAESLNARVQFLERNILEEDFNKHPEKYDLLVSNPPYVRYSESELMSSHVKDHEPGKALFVTDEDPLIFYKAITEYGNCTQNPGCRLYFEINEAFGKEMMDLMISQGFTEVKIYKDIHDKDRFAAGTKS